MSRRSSIFAFALTASLAAFSARADGISNPASGGAVIASGGVVKVAQQNIPLVVPSSGTMGNNGALSGITALQFTYANAYVYMPANAISAGSAAGWYYAQFSSTTAATLFNNVYTSGQPTIPASPTPFATTGPGAYTQTTGGTFQTAFNGTIPGGLLGPNGGLRVTYLLTNNNSAGGKAVRPFYGGYLLAQSTANASLNSYNITGIVNVGATNRQYIIGNGNALFGQTTTAILPGSVDSTQPQQFQLTWNLATATDTMTIENTIVEVIPGL